MVAVSLLLQSVQVTAANVPGGAGAEPTNTQPGDVQTVEIKPQYGVDSPRARQALEVGRAAKRRGDLFGAIRAFQEAHQYSAQDSFMHKEAKDELEFYLPLMRAHQVLIQGNREEAEKIVVRLQEFHSKETKRQQMLSDVLAKVRDPNFHPQPKKPADTPEQVMQKIQQILDTYRRANDDYPGGYSELNELLPVDRPPLKNFDIVGYARKGNGYRLEIRAKDPPHNTYSMERTGLLK